MARNRKPFEYDFSHIKVDLTLEEPWASELAHFAMATDAQSYSETIRLALTTFLASMPRLGLNHAQGRRAYIQTRNWALGELHKRLAEIQAMLEQSLANFSGSSDLEDQE